MKKKIALMWFYKDLRLEDNSAFYHALKENDVVIPIYLWSNSDNKRNDNFLFNGILELRNKLKHYGCDLLFFNSDNTYDIIERCFYKYNFSSIYMNDNRDAIIKDRLSDLNTFAKDNRVKINIYKDAIIFSNNEILKNGKLPYIKFSEYREHWLRALDSYYYTSYNNKKYYKNMKMFNNLDFPDRKDIFKDDNVVDFKIIRTDDLYIDNLLNQFFDKKIMNYHNDYLIPSLYNNSYFSLYLNIGLISIRKLLKRVVLANNNFLQDLIIFRDFIYHLDEYKIIELEGRSGKTSDKINDFFNGTTGIPIIDASINQLVKTGYISNTIRRLLVSFYLHNLNGDFEEGILFFKEYLIDYNEVINRLNWNIINNYNKEKIINVIDFSKYFDSDGVYIKKWLPHLHVIPSEYIHTPWEHFSLFYDYNITLGTDYPMPIINL